jgi:hypothetical protein
MLPYFLANPKRGLPLAVETLVALQRWLYVESNKLSEAFGHDMPLAKRLSGQAHHINDVLGLMPDAPAIEASGGDRETGRHAKHESAVPQGGAQ